MKKWLCNLLERIHSRNVRRYYDTGIVITSIEGKRHCSALPPDEYTRQMDILWERRTNSSGTFDRRSAGRDLAQGKWHVKREN